MAAKGQFQTLKLTLRKYVIKPASKRLLASCPTMYGEPSAQLTRTLPRYLLYAATLFTVCVTMWALYPASSDGDYVTLALSSNEIIKAVFKYA